MSTKPDSFKEFCVLCKNLAGEPSYNSKTAIIKKFIKDRMPSNGKYSGDLCLCAKLLLPATHKRVYNLKDKQLIKFFSQIFLVDAQDMTEHLENQGVISETIKMFFKESTSSIQPNEKSNLTLQDVDGLLENLSKVTKDDDQISMLQKICRKCTSTDLSYIIKLIKHDLRMNTGPKHFFDALDPNAYAAFQASNNIKTVIEKWFAGQTSNSSGLQRTLSIKASLMTPVKPMLAEACKSVEQAFKKCPNGMFSEIKYDGERVQIHKDGDNFQYFSRSLKPVQPHKIAAIKDFIPKACPKGDSLILDGEVLLMDHETNKPLPFGTLGIHKKSKFKDATVCYVIFDILQFNNENLLNKPIYERRNILTKHVTEIQNRIMHSEMKKLTKPSELQAMLKKCFAENLEGLVVKDVNSKYEPGKRHWLKIKKDYLQDGVMADTADLVVLGAYYGTGNKGGMMSVFLMGCYDNRSKQWVTVAKCGNGHDDDTLSKLQKELQMTKIGKDPAKVPSWLDVNRTLIPDFVATDPKNCPVWEITGAEFSQSTTHTADGISIRFPRVTKIRKDKDWSTATNLKQLKKLFEESKKTTDVEMEESVPDMKVKPADKPIQIAQNDTNEASSSKKKKRKSEEKLDNETKAKRKICEFGKHCYRKNKEHFLKYDHSNVQQIKSSEDSKNDTEKDTKESKQDLESIFTDMTFFLSNDLSSKETKKLKRYIIAYDGDVLEDIDDGKPTYIISNETVPVASNIPVITTEWVWSCIEKKKVE